MGVVLFRQAKDGDTALEYSAQDFRQLPAALWYSEGIVTPDALAVTAPGTGLTVSVAAGAAIVACDSVSNGGLFPVTETGSTTLTMPAPPSSGSRNHLIVERVRDPQSDGQASYICGPDFIQDTSGSFVSMSYDQLLAQVPDNCLLLAAVKIASNTSFITSDNITDYRAAALCNDAYLGHLNSSSNTNQSNQVPYQEQVCDTLKFTLARAGIVRITYAMNIHQVNGNNANAAQATLHSQSGYVDPTTSAVSQIDADNQAFSDAQVDVGAGRTIMLAFAAGQWTLNTTVMVRGGSSQKAYKAGGFAPSRLYAEFVRPT